ncbi:hypothetical protein D3C78_1168860 [compost metagenome]
MKRKYWIISCGFLLISTGIYFLHRYHQPELIHKQFNGVIYSNESNFVKESFIYIHGDLHKNLFGREVLIGELLLDTDLKYDIKLNDSDIGYFGFIQLHNHNDKTIKTIGSVMLSPNMDKTWIQLHDLNNRYHLQDAYVSGPAKNMEEGNDIARSFLEGEQ